MNAKSPAACPNCKASFRVLRENEGKRAKCPKCKQSFVISFENEPLSVDAADASSCPPIPRTNSKALSAQQVVEDRGDNDSRRSADMMKAFHHIDEARSANMTNASPPRRLIALAAIAVLGLVIGYFIGREHLKYQIESRMTEGFKAVFSRGASESSPNFNRNIPERDQSFITDETSEETVSQLQFGQTYHGHGFAITIAEAAVYEPTVKDFMGDRVFFKEPDLVLTFTIANTDDRKVLRFRKANQFGTDHFLLRDDVGNVIRGIDYGFGNDLVDALTGSEDILPGESATHIETFSVPPPKTEYLILTVNTACFDGDDQFEFKIPAASITR